MKMSGHWARTLIGTQMKEVFLFGIRFVDGSYEEIRQRIDRGGVMVVPAAPALATIYRNQQYYSALKQSDLAIFDSGLLCLLLRVFKGLSTQKLSGLAFLRGFLSNITQCEQGTIFLIDPSEADSVANRSLLKRLGYDLEQSHQYVAPLYGTGEIQDVRLLGIVKELKPKYIIVNLGGGVQERLGVYLAKSVDFSPSIFCTGAAIAFLSGRQASIPPLLDRLYLGWLARCISSPARFIPRYLQGFRLIQMIVNEKLLVKEVNI
jgi:N-acetylglucosaminyldiphosphoundecaprenol N-acetyl-beta-D-mannosaminyltransferase